MSKTLITGNTYPVKEQLKALGGRWDPRQKGWWVPADKAPEAQTIMASAPSKRSHSPGRSYARRRWAPCGYPGCHPNFCDECDGAGLYG